MNYAGMFTAEAWQEFVKIWSAGEFYNGIWATIYSTILATLFALIIGLPLGVLLVIGEEGGVRPLPKPVMTVLNTIINILRSIPFLILMIMVIPLSRVIVGTSIGTKGMIVPLVISAFPFISRLMESALREIDPGIIEAAQSMGASPFQIVMKVMLPETFPGIVGQITTAITTIMGYGAMAGSIGGDGLGKIAISYGYNRYKPLVMLIAVIFLVVLVIIFQTIGTKISTGSDKRLRR